MERSDSIKELATALGKAQAKIEGAAKDKTNPHFRSKYADLSSVREAINKSATDEGLSYVQVLHDGDASAAKVETVIMHKSGEWLSCGVIAVPVSKADAQGYGSALTYARRYSLSAAFGVAPEDDDGNAAAAAAPREATARNIVAAQVSPTAGLRDQLKPERLVVVEKVASNVIDCFEVGEVKTAYEVIEEAKFDTDEKAALWTFLSAGHRSALKRFHKEHMDSLLATQP